MEIFATARAPGRWKLRWNTSLSARGLGVFNLVSIPPSATILRGAPREGEGAARALGGLCQEEQCDPAKPFDVRTWKTTASRVRSTKATPAGQQEQFVRPRHDG